MLDNKNMNFASSVLPAKATAVFLMHASLAESMGLNRVVSDSVQLIILLMVDWRPLTSSR